MAVSRIDASSRMLGGALDGVTVIRVGTQVVVRLSGDVDDNRAERLSSALLEIADLVLNRVVIDCSAATEISGAGLGFLQAAQARWPVRLLDPPPDLRQSLNERRAG
jgi:anti-anti-sigma regulatory factor